MCSEINTKATGNVTKLMDKESSPMSMDRRTMVPGRTISNMEKVSNTGTITPNMTELTTKETSTDLEATLGQMDQITLDNGFKIELKDKVLTLGKTEEST